MILFISCSTYDCTKVDIKPCGTLCEQAKNLVNKLLEHPDAWICILENEKCINCQNYLQLVYQDNHWRESDSYILTEYSKYNCKIISECYQQVLPNIKTKPEIPEGTIVYVLTVAHCDIREVDSGACEHPMELEVWFKIVNENQWELYWFWTA
jgi:hypothetical protein